LVLLDIDVVGGLALEIEVDARPLADGNELLEIGPSETVANAVVAGDLTSTCIVVVDEY
jgi:hypothetical protein